METASLVISIIAALFAGGAVWYARGAKKAAADAAEEAVTWYARSRWTIGALGAIRAARGAKIAAADAAEEAVGYQGAEVEPGRVVVRLRHIGGISYRLVNDGTDTAYGVQVDTGELGVGEQETDYDELHSGQAVEFLLSPNLATTSRHVAVTWHERPDLSDEKRAARLII
jgi:hypothetical protein